VFSSTFLRSWIMSPESFHLMPESSSPMATSGRPRVTWKAVFTGLPAATQDPVPEGNVAWASTRLMPVTPQSSSCWELFWVMAWYSAGLDFCAGGIAGVAANFQARPPRLPGTWPGASAQLAGSPAVPSPT
jgi:hypothetical protein